MSGYETEILIATIAAQSYQAYETGQQAASQARAEAAWHAYNAKVSQREADAERQAAAFEAQQHKRQAEQLLARGRAIRGGMGVTAEGSPLLVAEDTAGQLALENAMIRLTGTRRVAKWKSQSILDISKSSAARSAAAGHKRAGYWRAGTSLLGGALTGYERDSWG